MQATPLNRALRLKTGDAFAISYALLAAGRLRMEQDRPQAALVLQEEALALRLTGGPGRKWGLANYESEISETLVRLGRHEEARDRLRKSLEDFDDILPAGLPLRLRLEKQLARLR